MNTVEGRVISTTSPNPPPLPTEILMVFDTLFYHVGWFIPPNDMPPQELQKRFSVGDRYHTALISLAAPAPVKVPTPEDCVTWGNWESLRTDSYIKGFRAGVIAAGGTVAESEERT